jgi:lycopene beta-cyclase
MTTNPFFRDKSVLLVDEDAKNKNDRTWCFWEKTSGSYDAIVHKRWNTLTFYNNEVSERMEIDPYVYKMIRGIDFYTFNRQVIKAAGIHWIQGRVDQITERNDGVVIKVGGQQFKSPQVFKSYPEPSIDLNEHLSVLQHFGGWFIKSDHPVFDPRVATFMDFRIDQKDETRFFYVLPISDKEALIEIAIFSHSVWQKDDYDRLITDYITTYLEDVKDSFVITEKEYGAIPMTTYPFWEANTKRITHIGTAGGAVKPSSGYAFSRIQLQSEHLLQLLVNQKSINTEKSVFNNIYLHYDATLLDVILKQRLPASYLFGKLFEKNKPSNILAFLNHETSFLQEVAIFSSMPILPFTKGFMKSIFS